MQTAPMPRVRTGRHARPARYRVRVTFTDGHVTTISQVLARDEGEARVWALLRLSKPVRFTEVEEER